MRTATAFALVALLPMAGCLGGSQASWALQATQLDRLAGRADGASVRVAILDTGIDPSLPSLRHLTDGDLDDGELVAYQDFLNGDTRPRDDDGHGSMVAGILAGREPSGWTGVLHPREGLQGLAPSVHLLVGRLCDGHGRCSLFGLLSALQWILQQEADVVSLSLGFTPGELVGLEEYVRQVRELLGQMERRGVLVVAAAGNDAAGGMLFPADDPAVVAVGAVGRDLLPRDRTAYGGGDKPDLAAPGEAIVAPAPGGLRSVDGTSAAVPFVVAAAALMMQAGPDPADGAGLARLRHALESTARPVPGQITPRDPRTGLGLLQADAAWRAYAW